MVKLCSSVRLWFHSTCLDAKTTKKRKDRRFVLAIYGIDKPLAPEYWDRSNAESIAASLLTAKSETQETGRLQVCINNIAVFALLSGLCVGK